MAYVTEYKYDVFVSYAHVDNQLISGAKDGWISTFVRNLETRLSQRLGRSEFYKLWIDNELTRNQEITPQILNALQESAIIIIMLSPGYINSPWCRKEFSSFFNLIQDRKRSGSRVFIVERDMVDDTEKPIEIKDLISYTFWVNDRKGRAPKILGSPEPKSSEPQYYELINDLTFDIEKELKRLKQLDKKGSVNLSTDAVAPTIFLAEVTDDLDPLRNEVKRYLDQQGIKIVPESYYPSDESQYIAKVEEDLQMSKLFVQLISGISGRRVPSKSKTYSQLQYDCALKSETPMLQWRSRELDLSLIYDINQKELLEKETVLAVGMEEFKRTIIDLYFHEPVVEERQSVNAFVFVNMESHDREVANSVIECLDKNDIDFAMPILEGKPNEIRLDLERNLLECDGIIIVYGNITVSWVREQLRQCRKILAKRDRPLNALAVYEGPPESKVPLDLKLHNMHVLNCRKGYNHDALVAFMKSLKVSA